MKNENTVQHTPGPKYSKEIYNRPEGIDEAERLFPLSMIGGGITKSDRQRQQSAFCNGVQYGTFKSSRLKAENEEMLAMLKECYDNLREWRQNDLWTPEDQTTFNKLYTVISKVCEARKDKSFLFKNIDTSTLFDKEEG